MDTTTIYIARIQEGYGRCGRKIELHTDEHGALSQLLYKNRFIAIFKNASLDNLTKNLKRDDFCHTLRHLPADKVHMLLRKGVFCYDYWDCPEKVLDVSLPPRAAFFSRLTEEGVTLQDYWHAVSVRREFDIRNLGEHHDLYLKTDVLILADVFETFRSVCIKNYGLDAAHYFSSPDLAWDAMLKMTEVRLAIYAAFNH